MLEKWENGSWYFLINITRGQKWPDEKTENLILYPGQDPDQF